MAINGHIEEDNGSEYVEVSENEEVDLGADLLETAELFADYDSVIAGNESANDLLGMTELMLVSDEAVSGKEALAVKVLTKAVETQYGYEGNSPVVSNESDGSHTIIKSSNEGASEMLKNGWKATKAIVEKLIHAIRKLYISIAKKLRKFSKRIEKAKETINKASEADVTGVEASDSKLKAHKKSLVGLMASSGVVTLNKAGIDGIANAIVDVPKGTADVATGITSEFRKLIDTIDTDSTTVNVLNEAGLDSVTHKGVEMDESFAESILESSSKVRKVISSKDNAGDKTLVICGNGNTTIALAVFYIGKNNDVSLEVGSNKINSTIINSVINLKGNEMPDKAGLLALAKALSEVKTAKSSSVGDKISETTKKLDEKLTKKYKDLDNAGNMIKVQSKYGAVSRGLLMMVRESELAKYTNVGNVLALLEYYAGKVKKSTKSNKKSGTASDTSDNETLSDFIIRYS
jgi:hypothetical protein